MNKVLKNKINWRSNVVSKRSFRLIMNFPRYFIRFFYSKANKKSSVICNSFPKSGTYLLFPILRSILELKDWGNFIASKPSFTYKEISSKKISKRIKSIVPNELVGAHIYYNDDNYSTLLENNCIMFFIYRDPRDVVISEANYLYDMNRYHRLHKFFKKYPKLEDRIMFSIQGDNFYKTPFQYLDIKKRFNKYKGWINCKNVFSIKYEDLISEKEKYIMDILKFYKEDSSKEINWEMEDIVNTAIENSAPNKSHTYRNGGKNKWEKYFTEEHQKAFKEIAGNLLIELGYEKNYNW